MVWKAHGGSQAAVEVAGSAVSLVKQTVGNRIMKTQLPVSIEPSSLRVEFRGSMGPTHLVVPVLFREGKYEDLVIKIRPRTGVSLENSVVIGDALQDTFSTQHSVSAGGSFFAEASYSFASSIDRKLYEVVWLPDFRGIMFRLHKYEVSGETIGLQFAFPITNYTPDIGADYSAEISLELRGEVIEVHHVPQVVHPNAGRVLLLLHSSEIEHCNAAFYRIARKLSELRVMYIAITSMVFSTLQELTHILASGFEGIHLLVGNIYPRGMRNKDELISVSEFFTQLNGLGLKFLYIDSCDSVQVVSAFRKTDVGALIAATESLSVSYADGFAELFYQELGKGAYISQAFQYASQQQTAAFAAPPPTRSGFYDPMFLDLRTDFSFKSGDS